MSGFDDYLASAKPAQTAAPAQAASPSDSFDSYLQSAAAPSTPDPQNVAAAKRATALTSINAPFLQPVAMGAELARNAIDAHMAPDSWIRRGADAVLGNTSDAAAALDQHLGNLPLSAAQMAAHGVAAVGDALSPQQQSLSGLITGQAPARQGFAGSLDKARASLDQTIQGRNQTYQAGIPTDAGSLAGATAGEVLPFLAGGEASVGAKLNSLADSVTSFAKSRPLVQKILSGALQGGAYGAASPVTNTDPNSSFASQKLGQVGTGMLTGGTIPVLGSAAGEAYNVVRPFVNPRSVSRQFLGNIVGDDAAAVAQRLRTAPTYVQGSLPTSAQAGGSTPLVQAEDALANKFPDFKTALMQRDIANNDARIGALTKLAGSPADMQAAKDARRAAIDPFVSNYLNPQTRMDPTGVLSTLQGLRYGPLGVNAQRAAKLDNLITSLQGATTPDGTIGVDMADAVRQEAGKLSRGSSGQNGLAYGPANDSIVQAIDRVAPGYPDYLRTYAQTSQPISDMGAASTMVDSLGSGARNSAGSPQVTLPAFNSQLRKLDKLPYSVSPGMQSTLDGIQQDLQRASISNSVRTPGSNTAYNLNTPGWLASKIYGHNLSGGGAIGKMAGAALGSVIPGVGMLGGYLGTEKLAAIARSRVMGAVQDAMLNPSVMAQELDKLAATNPSLARLLGRSVRPGIVSTAPQLTNQNTQP